MGVPTAIRCGDEREKMRPVDEQLVNLGILLLDEAKR